MASWGLIVAIEDYPDMSGWDKHLPGTNAAAARFRTWLIEKKQIPAANIVACAGPSCSWRTAGTRAEEFIAALTGLVARCRDNCDELHFFFSGHGVAFDEDAQAGPVDLVAMSEFAHPSTGGRAVVRIAEVKEKLRLALGPGSHFYFIDACRNPIARTDIAPSDMGVAFGRSQRGNATTYVLFSTAPGDAAIVSDKFGAALIDGLSASGRAKVWIRGDLKVTFDSLCSFVQQRLNKSDLDPEKRGPGDGTILLLKPPPQTTCEVEVRGAEPQAQFQLAIKDIRDGLRPSVVVHGRRETLTLLPDDYRFTLTTSAGAVVPQVEPLPPDPVDLYSDARVAFDLGAPPTGGAKGMPSGPTLEILAPRGTHVEVEDVATGATEGFSGADTSITPAVRAGRIRVKVREGDLKLASKDVQLGAGDHVTLDLRHRPVDAVRRSIAARVPTSPGLINFSEALGDIPDSDLNLWLDVLGASRIVADPLTFSKLRDLPLADFRAVTPNRSVVYVLSAQPAADPPRFGIGPEPTLTAMRAVPGLDGIFESYVEVDPGPSLVSISVGRAKVTTIAVHALANRATFLTLATGVDARGRKVHHFSLPIHSLESFLDDEVLRFLKESPDRPLRLVRYMATVQNEFALQRPVKGRRYGADPGFWWDLLYAKWLDPLMALLACYELIRRGEASNDGGLMRTVVGNLRRHFPGIADTEVIASLIGEPADLRGTPLFLEGILATEVELPLPRANLDYASTWTTWLT
jgi:hypothetical protein